MPLSIWGGPPTSGNSTPLRENIPESPTDGFPDFAQLPTPDTTTQTRRTRAGTLPSRFSPGGPTSAHIGIPGAGLGVKSARHTPSQTPYNKSPSPNLESNDAPASGSTLLSRLRAGSMPQRSQFAPLPGTSSPFGPSIFSSWNPIGTGRERGQTLASIASVGSNNPSSPAQSQFSREGASESDVHMRTLDYLGLAETPQPPRAQLATPYIPSMDMMRQANRFRSYSVNNKEVHAAEYPAEEDDLEGNSYIRLQDQFAATQVAIHAHNMAVQAFAKQAARPRALTAGVLEKPPGRLMNQYFANEPHNPNHNPAHSELRLQDEQNFDDLPRAVAGMTLHRSNSHNLLSPDEGLEGPTSALWLGNIPTSTTTSTLHEMFKGHGPILSVRVLTHKNCGFVNFEKVESAVSAKANMNGKEIFPGASPIRINFAKPVSPGNTPGHDGAYPSPSPVPFGKGQETPEATGSTGEATAASLASATLPPIPTLTEIGPDILEVAARFAPEDDGSRLAQNVQSAIQFNQFYDEIPAIKEPTHNRIHDAPKLRDIRKRIDNSTYSVADIENVAMDMLPEIAELSSDYLGNTVVQKLFEHCSDAVRDAMLAEIAPHLAQIGVHKNGTWAAQKIIDVCNTHNQKSLIVENLRPYTMPLFLDQFGNYVLQCCLKFGSPYSDFIFETMLSRLWPLAQGRYGARAMRACLESHFSTKDQQRLVASSIVINAVHLATNTNGALLLTWYLDTCTFQQRRTVLAPQLQPYLAQLGVHKIAYLTVLKLINQKTEPEPRDALIKSLFFSPNDQVLEAILGDPTSGVALIFKVLTTPFFEDSIRAKVIENVKNVLIKLKAQSNQGYKRLMDEVGMTTRNSGPSRDSGAQAEQRQRPNSRHTNMNGGQNQYGSNKGYHNQMNAGNNQAAFDMAYSGRNDAPDTNGMSTFPTFNQG